MSVVVHEWVRAIVQVVPARGATAPGTPHQGYAGARWLARVMGSGGWRVALAGGSLAMVLAVAVASLAPGAVSALRVARAPNLAVAPSGDTSNGPTPGTPTLYVAPGGSDANPGTADQPLQTIAQAARLATPGTTIRVAPGDYPDRVVTRTSGTPDARVRFVSASRWGARIRTSRAEQAWLNMGSYVDIVGFDVSAPDARLGIQNEGSNVRIQHNHVHDVAVTLNSDGCNHNGGAGIVNANTDTADNEISANVVHDIGDSTNAKGTRACWTVHGIYDATPRGKVLNNIAYRNEAFGIHLWHAATGNVVSSNLSFNNGVGGIQVGAGDAPGGVTADNYVIANNIVLDNPLYGIRAAGALGSHNRYLDNLVYRNGSAYAGVDSGITGTLEADPQFINYQPDGFAAGGDYHLQPTSPAIGAGTSTGAPSIDYDDAVRPSAAGYTAGPFESSASVARTAGTSDTSPGAPSASGAATLFGPSAVPVVAASGAGQVVELGVRFRSSVDGSVTGIRFFKSSLNTGVHTGSLWSATGELLARATFSDETTSGWQQVNFSVPVAIQANTVYVASYHTDTGNYAYDEGFFADAPVTSGPLTAMQNSQTDGPNGVFVYGPSAFPDATWKATNYWVDVVFSPTDPSVATAR